MICHSNAARALLAFVSVFLCVMYVSGKPLVCRSFVGNSSPAQCTTYPLSPTEMALQGVVYRCNYGERSLTFAPFECGELVQFMAAETTATCNAEAETTSSDACIDVLVGLMKEEFETAKNVMDGDVYGIFYSTSSCQYLITIYAPYGSNKSVTARLMKLIDFIEQTLRLHPQKRSF